MQPEAFEFRSGDSPLLLSIPHGGEALTAEISEKLTETGRLLPDTDWHLGRLYDCVKDLKPSLIRANYSRYVVDLNRPLDDKPLYTGNTTGLFTQTLFNGEPLYHTSVSETARQEAIEQIWRPYYQQIADELARIKAKYGYALLFDAHSIRSCVPYLFDGQLPSLNLGTNQGQSCAPELAQVASQICDDSPFGWVLNGRFKGGFITRHFGQPDQNIHAIQLEMAQSLYMNEEAPFEYYPEMAAQLQPTLTALLTAYLKQAEQLTF
ncbi:MAG: hypothetical protein CENE_00607 [Candidatus Celerinatantimonas neptuna]|nr:MAG: hypothetical protein CENE_00607 [Candidatus Celerinatantimonas neptuna]